MENNNYVNVGNIIEQERLKRQAQIAKGVSSDVYDHIEKAYQDDLSKGVEMTDNLSRFADDVDNLNKAETEFLLSKLQRQIVADPESSLLKSFKSIAINHLNDIEKAVYADTAENRKMGRVGQQYGGVGSRGGKGKTHQERQAAFKQKHSALVDKWKKEGNIAGLKKEIAAIKMEYGSDRQTAEKKIKPLEDAIAAAKSKKNINIKAEDEHDGVEDKKKKKKRRVLSRYQTMKKYFEKHPGDKRALNDLRNLD